MKTTLGLRALSALLGLYAAAGCSRADGSTKQAEAEPANNGHLFTRLASSYTGVRFENRVTDTRDLNIFTYRNYYNGGGVALGDLNGDGLPDLLLTSNLRGNRLYLNEGRFRFRDVTQEAAVRGKGFWATGATFVDVNGDGLLDIYVCYAGNVAGERRANELYVNQGVDADGVPQFTEMASEYGIADEGYSTHAAFFDYDRDGDLDLYVVNNSFRPVSSFGLRNIRHVRDELGGDKLFRNDDGRFVDVSAKAGIFGSVIGFGLGVAIGDVNGDGWADIYVSNDFFERDYLYINRRNGTFAERLEAQMPSISYSSMGLDIADINNDGLVDIFVTDMLPEDEYRYKTTSAFESWDVYQTKLRNRYHHQFARNMLHLNNGNGTFSDVGQMSGVDRTDWSWSALIADFDLDGLKDIHVTNGMPRDVTSQDYISFLANNETMASATRGRRVDFLGLVKAMSSTPLPNHAFRNAGDLTFASTGTSWGLDTRGFSNGAAYGDLDGDGALDLVVNNVNQEAFIYRNDARALLKNGYLQVVLRGAGKNRFAIGAKITAYAGGRTFFQELMPSRGFQSSVDYVLTFGLGTAAEVDSVTVTWPDGRRSVIEDVAVNSRLVVRHSSSVAPGVSAPAKASTPLFADVTRDVQLGFVHRENAFVDFDRERLIPKMLSTEGPALAVADVNGDGLTDAFFGGAKDQPSQLLIQRPGGGFTPSNERLFEADRISEDVAATFFDANGDAHPDLYVVTGGSEYSDMAPALEDRLYLNDGRGNLRRTTGNLPRMSGSGSRVAAADFDGDGDSDLFVGGRVVPGRYGLDPVSALLQNDGRGRFRDVTATAAPELARVGMVTDALWRDIDGDRRTDLVIVGEWMPITIFRNVGNGKLRRLDVPALAGSHGWWNRIAAGDFTGDGRVDFVVGNLGLNSRFTASATRPASMHVKDFDGNGFIEQIISCYNGDRAYPLALRDDLIKSLPYLKARYLSYESYANETVTDVFSPAELRDAVVKRAYTFATTLLRNDGNGSFTLIPLPHEAQLAPVYGILPGDFDRDGRLDLLLAGNFDGVKPEIGRMTASYGLFLRGTGNGKFTPARPEDSGFFVSGQARDIQRIGTGKGAVYVVARNNAAPAVFHIHR